MKQILILAFLLFHLITNSSGQVKIKAEKFFPFCQGFAIVNYGSSYGVIDHTGNFIIPYNKFHLENFGLASLEPKHGFINGGCVAINLANNQQGMIDIKGNWIIPAEYMLVYPFDNEGWARVTDFKENDFFINKSGNRVPVSPAFFAYRANVFSGNGGLEDLFNGGASRHRALSGKEYFGEFRNGLSPGGTAGNGRSLFNRSGKQMITEKFSSIEPLREGLSCASRVNEFGETKYGFVDAGGKVVIPFSYTNKPGSFYNGLAYVEPLARNEFDFGFINKQGELVLKLKNVTPVSQSPAMPHFEDGYFRMFVKDGSAYYFRMIDSTGKDVAAISALKDRLRFSNVDNKSFGTFTDHIQIFNYNAGTAFLNIDNGKIVYTNFSQIKPFDPVSGLALATEGRSGASIYINMMGNGVIGAGPKSEF